MYIFKNAFVSITRNIGSNLLIGIIIIVISCETAVTLAIKNSANSLIESYKNKYDVVATIGINRESMRGEMQQDKDDSAEDKENNKENMIDIFSTVSSISTDDINNYGDSEYVKDYYYQKSIGVNSDDIEKASSTSENDSNEDNLMSRGGKQSFNYQSSGDFILNGYSSISGMKDFISGKYEITNGEVSDNFTEDNCVINSELATLNNI